MHWGPVKSACCQFGLNQMKVQHGIVSEIKREIVVKIRCFSIWDRNESVKVESESVRSTNELHRGPVKSACCQFGLNN